MSPPLVLPPPPPQHQGEAIAYNLREMFGLRVPVISVVIGEGGSGGALAIGCANRNLIMENAVYYVASPEACAAILWKSRTASSQVRPGGAWGLVGEGWYPLYGWVTACGDLRRCCQKLPSVVRWEAGLA